jgi:dihydrofolate reductase
MIKAIIATDSEGGIGKNGTIPWPPNKEDLKHFKNLTTGHIVVMGSKTWLDPCFPAPLKNRDNYIVTSKTEGFDGATIMRKDFKSQILELSENKTVWIIGGASVIEQCIDIIDEIHLTVIRGYFDCDTFFKYDKKQFTIIENTYSYDNTYYVLERNI